MIYYKEEQQVSRTFIWLVMGSVSTLMIGIITYAVYQQLYLNHPWGDSPMSDNALIALSIFAFTTIAFIIWLLMTIKLEVKIDKREIAYRFSPLQRSFKKILKSNISDLYIRKYNAIREFGGYGYCVRLWSNTKALIIRGNMGMQIVFKDQKKLLIGTQQPDTLKEIVGKFMQTAEVEDYG